MPLLSKNNPYLLMYVNTTFTLPTTSTIHMFSIIDNKKKNHPLNKKYMTIMNDQPPPPLKWRLHYSIILPHDDFLKYLDKNNTTFKEDIEASFKKKIVKKLQLNIDEMMETINQRFISFQSVMLNTMKYLIIQIVPQLYNQQYSNLLSPSPHDMIQTQPLTYLYQEAFLRHCFKKINFNSSLFISQW